MTGFTDSRYEAAHYIDAPVPVAHVALDGRFTSVNRAMCEFLGYAESEMLALRWQDITYSPDIGPDEDEIRKLVFEGTWGYSLVKRYRAKNGVLRWINLHVRVIRNASGSVDHFVSWILPLPNGGNFKAEKQDDNTVLVRPTIKLLDLFLDNWKTFSFVGVFVFIILLASAEAIKQDLFKLLELLK